MRLPNYPAYKDSGIQWLGQIPVHWKTDRIKASIASARNGIWGDEPKGDENDIACVRVADFDRVKFQVKPQIPTIRSITAKERDGRSLRRGDLLLEKSGGGELQPVGQVVMYQLDTPAVCSNFLARLVLRPGMNSSYWKYVHNAAYSVGVNLGSINQTSGIQNLDQDRYFNEPAPFPPEPEQSAIGVFLDRETAKIESLIAEQEKLIARLAEKRHALITRTVLRGLNPGAPMKDSGVPWIGQVPAHWNVSALGTRYSVQLGKMLDSAKISGEHLRPYLRVFDVQWGRINTFELPMMDFDETAREKFRLVPGDILVNEGGSYPGRSAIWTGPLRECYYQKALHRLRPYSLDEDDTDFFYFVMSWAANQGVFVAGGNETTIEHLPAERLRRYRFAFPPIAEQRQIASFLTGETEKLDSLKLHVQRGIDLLKERRNAVIVAAVTGQIDVRTLMYETVTEQREGIAA